jgi:hypothetical protein
MSDPKRSLEYLLHEDTRRFVEQQLGAQPWVTVYGQFPGERGKLFCGLVPNGYVDAALDNMGWDLLIGNGKPGCTTRYDDGKEVVTYHRLSEARGEPLVIVRNFDGLRPSFPEISEEFRLFHNLFHETRTDTYFKFNENGDEEEVIRICDGEVQVRMKEIRQYLAIREMHLALYCEAVRYSPEPLSSLNPPERRPAIRTELLRYDVGVGDATPTTDGSKSLSRLIGKKLIPPLPKEKSDFWPYQKPKQHADFIVGVDAGGEPVSFTSDPDQLSNYFVDRGAPHYLTPVFFKREVLAKYFARPSRYEVRDGRLSCAGLWIVQIDTEVPGFVVVFLGDLGRDLPYEEQLYWKAFNVAPEGGISATNFKRSFSSGGFPTGAFKGSTRLVMSRRHCSPTADARPRARSLRTRPARRPGASSARRGPSRTLPCRGGRVALRPGTPRYRRRGVILRAFPRSTRYPCSIPAGRRSRPGTRPGE